MKAIAPGVHQLSLGSHAFLVDGDQGVTLVDTGMPGREGVVAEGLRSIGRSWSDLHAILVTHAHVDHVGSAAAIRRDAPGATLAMSATDAHHARGETSPPPPPVADRLGPLRWLFRFVPDPPPVEVDHLVSETRGPHADGGVPDDIRVLDSPGHTPGHLCYLLDRADGLLFVGDAAVATRSGGVARGPMNRSTPTFDDSLRHLAEFTFDRACFGHSRPLTRGASGAFRALSDQLG